MKKLGVGIETGVLMVAVVDERLWWRVEIDRHAIDALETWEVSGVEGWG